MKNFLYSFLGTLAGIWVTIILGGILLVMSLVIVAVSGSSNSKTQIKSNSILYLDLSGEITENPQKRDLFAEIQGENYVSMPLNQLTAAIRRAASDNKIKGIFIECNDVMAGLAQSEAIIQAIADFKKDAPEKWVYSYGDYYTQSDYFIACAADSMFINPQGMIDIHGLSTTGLYFKNLLDKLGVKMQVVKVGTYKSAVEPYILTQPSEASVEQQRLFLDNMWGQICKSIAERRHISADSVNAWANSLQMAADTKSYVANKMVDRSLYRHQFIDKLKSLTDKKGSDKLNLITPTEYAEATDLYPESRKSSAKIGIYYASGDIVDAGKNGISAERMVPDLIDLAEEDELDALIIRVNSPGGSAFASEQIWEAVQTFKEMTGKPVYVSMSDYAASGGYYISCGADKIYAQPLTLTGSIGIFGLIPDAENLITDKIGITTHTISTNPEGELPSAFKPMTPSQRMQMQAYVERGYELFVKRVADGRKLPVDSVKRIAEGRVWDGKEALARGLVDKLGGLDMALADLAKELNVENYELRQYPDVEMKWWEAIIELSSDMETRFENKMLRRSLGNATELFEAMRTLGQIQPVQARMEYVKVKL